MAFLLHQLKGEMLFWSKACWHRSKLVQTGEKFHQNTRNRQQLVISSCCLCKHGLTRAAFEQIELKLTGDLFGDHFGPPIHRKSLRCRWTVALRSWCDVYYFWCCLRGQSQPINYSKWVSLLFPFKFYAEHWGFNLVSCWKEKEKRNRLEAVKVSITLLVDSGSSQATINHVCFYACSRSTIINFLGLLDGERGMV